MIASLRGLAILGAVAVVLVVALIAAPRPEAGWLDRRLLFFDDSITKLELRPTSGAPIVLSRDGREPWKIENGPHADQTTVDALISALSAAKWHRRADASVAGALRGELRVSLGAHDVRSYMIGRELPGSAQTWVVHEGHALLVDTWVARALWPDPLTLQLRLPFEEAQTASSLSAGPIFFAGRYQKTPVTRWIADAPFRELTSALEAVEIVAQDRTPTEPKGRSITIQTTDDEKDSFTYSQVGACGGGRVYIESRRTRGCVDSAAWDRAFAAFERFAKEDPSVVDTRLVPFVPDWLRFQDGDINTDVSFRKIRDGMDPDRVAELAAALVTRGEIVPRPAGAPRTTLRVFDPSSAYEVELAIVADVIARKGEAFALRVPKGVLEIIARPRSALLSNVLWREDPLTVSTITIDRVTYKRGVVMGEWLREPAGKLDVALVEALAESLASVRGTDDAPPRAIAHRITVTLAPPIGGPKTHTLELAAPTAGGCTARVDGKPVRVELPLCMAAAALAGSR